MYEEAFFALLNALHEKYDCSNLALSGGCAMNSVANGKVYLKSPFKKMYLPAAAGDAGGAIGAAFVVWNQHGGQKQKGSPSRQPSPPSLRSEATAWQAGEGETPARDRKPSALKSQPSSRFVMRHAYTGPEFHRKQIEALLEFRGLVPESYGLSTALPGLLVSPLFNSEELCRRTARAISEGKVVGWFQGRMEWGPRALGNRSILCDPRRPDMKAILNEKIKRRESFRPFAPSILREHVAEWFEQDDDVPFMMQVFQVRPEKRSLVPAITHVDGSGRLHTVHRDTNPLYHRLISEFCALTSVPMVLNTSFNENEPVVCRPAEALDCFLRTKMDVLVLGNFFISRQISPAEKFEAGLKPSIQHLEREQV